MKKQKNARNILFNIFCLAVLLLVAVLCVFSFSFNKLLFTVSLAVLLALVILLLLARNHLKHSAYKDIIYAAEVISGEKKTLLNEFNMPIVIFSENNYVQWCNKAFSDSVCSTEKIFSKKIDEIIDEDNLNLLKRRKTVDLALNDKIFKTYYIKENGGGILFFVDETSLKKTETEYKFSRPVVAVLAIDSLNEVLKGKKESKKAQICSTVQDMVEKWFSHTDGVMHNISNDTFLLIFEQRHLKSFEDEKFKILEDIRNLEIDGQKNLTLSIGVSYGCKTLHLSEESARKALDMALGRGGDQAAVKSPDTEYKFYGAVKAVAEKGSRVRARITANALKDIIRNSSNVIIMGHRFSDLDSLGASYALAKIVRNCGADSKIVLKTEETMASPLLNLLGTEGENDIFISEEKALDIIDTDTLLIVADTNRPGFLESGTLYERIKKNVVIDHHRRSPDCIDNAIIFYNETVSSSTCEIVTELWQYMCDENIDRVSATALLSGITLDTKNFVLNTGVRTYEAAAYLRKYGADPIIVKRLFADNMEVYKRKFSVISTAEIYGVNAIAVNENDSEVARLISAQAADDLLNVENIKASFVLFKTANKISISARSLGDINVQLIMESLGGGGHKNMAACVLDVTDFKEAIQMLLAAIDEYNQNNER